MREDRTGDGVLKRLEVALIAITLSGIVALSAQSSWSQDLPGTRQPGAPSTEKPRGGQPPGHQQVDGMAGMSQEKIKRVEEALQERGHNPGRIDGIADERTRNALREFQKLNNLSVTGVLDERTAEKLGVQLREGAPPPMKKEAPGLRGSLPGSQTQAG